MLLSMASLIRKRKIWWEPVPEVGGYMVYVGKDEIALDPANFSWETTPGIISKLVIGKNELIIPDDWPEFPTEPGILMFSSCPPMAVRPGG